jgi:hypothetical protein
MVETPSLQTNNVYSIALMKRDLEWCVYQVRVNGDIHRLFFIEMRAAQNAGGGAIERIASFCEANSDRLPEHGGIISLD